MAGEVVLVHLTAPLCRGWIGYFPAGRQKEEIFEKFSKRQYRPNVNGIIITLFDSPGQELFQDIEALDISRVGWGGGGGV